MRLRLTSQTHSEILEITMNTDAFNMYVIAHLLWASLLTWTFGPFLLPTQTLNTATVTVLDCTHCFFQFFETEQLGSFILSELEKQTNQPTMLIGVAWIFPHSRNSSLNPWVGLGSPKFSSWIWGLWAQYLFSCMEISHNTLINSHSVGSWVWEQRD